MHQVILVDEERVHLDDAGEEPVFRQRWQAANLDTFDIGHRQILHLFRCQPILGVYTKYTLT